MRLRTEHNCGLLAIFGAAIIAREQQQMAEVQRTQSVHENAQLQHRYHCYQTRNAEQSQNATQKILRVQYEYSVVVYDVCLCARGGVNGQAACWLFHTVDSRPRVLCWHCPRERERAHNYAMQRTRHGIRLNLNSWRVAFSTRRFHHWLRTALAPAVRQPSPLRVHAILISAIAVALVVLALCTRRLGAISSQTKPNWLASPNTSTNTESARISTSRLAREHPRSTWTLRRGDRRDTNYRHRGSRGLSNKSITISLIIF